ncbi:hypothetical protein KP509_1Z132600 [Ceratopteris richardii]|nr:hypothetical protein KP509_1Z132600 [Ceratopteris richardii]
MKKENLPKLSIIITTVIAAFITQVAGNGVHLLLPPPIRCARSAEGGEGIDCTVEAYQRVWQDRRPCRAARAVYPTTEAQIFQAVAWASRSGSKIKVVSRGAHSITKLVCPGGDSGLLISTHYYNSLIQVDPMSRTVTAHSGVMLRQLLDAVAYYNLSLPHTPYWQGVSVAGVISTGAHGSGLWGLGSALHDYVVGLRLVVPAPPHEGYARIIDLEDGHEDLDAARLSLGVLGVISTITFKLEPIFKRSVTLELKGDDDLEDEIVRFAKAHEFAGLNWYPGTRKVLYKVDDRVDVASVGNGAYGLSMVEKMTVQEIESIRHALDVLEETQDGGGVCELEHMAVLNRFHSGDGLLNDGLSFKGYPVVGYSHNMQTAGGCEEVSSPMTETIINLPHFNDPSKDCEGITDTSMESITKNTIYTCFWNPLINRSIFFYDVAISVPMSKANDAITEIKKLRDLSPDILCTLGSLGGFWIRFQAKSKAYMGVAHDSVMFEFFHYRAREASLPRFRQDLFEEIEQMLLNKFNGLPHWGKNRILAFDDMHRRVRAMEKFMQVKKKFDPFDLFSNEWTDAIFGDGSARTTAQSLNKYCALEGLCVCREDSHCNPSRGYFCRPGRVFNEANVCRHEDSIPIFAS